MDENSERFERAGDGLRPLRAVHRLTVALHEAESPLAFYEGALDAVVATLGVDRASLLLFDPHGVMRFKAWPGLSARYRQAVEGHTPWSPGDADVTAILVPDVAAAPELAGLLPVLRSERIAALTFIPLVHHGRVVGKFMLYYDQPHEFSASEGAVAEILAAQVALAHERRRAEDALRSSGQRFRRLIATSTEAFIAMLGDVCGRGVPAAALAILTRYTIRSAAVTVADPAAILSHANQVLLTSQPAGVHEPRVDGVTAPQSVPLSVVE